MPSVAAIYLLRGWRGWPGAIKLFASSAFKSALPQPLSHPWVMVNLPAEGGVWSEKDHPSCTAHPNTGSAQPNPATHQGSLCLTSCGKTSRPVWLLGQWLALLLAFLPTLFTTSPPPRFCNPHSHPFVCSARLVSLQKVTSVECESWSGTTRPRFESLVTGKFLSKVLIPAGSLLHAAAGVRVQRGNACRWHCVVPGTW